jgi:predicted secreted protein
LRQETRLGAAKSRVRQAILRHEVAMMRNAGWARYGLALWACLCLVAVAAWAGDEPGTTSGSTQGKFGKPMPPKFGKFGKPGVSQEQTSQTATQVFTEAVFDQSITVPARATFAFRLRENPTTGYRWEVKTWGVVVQIGDQFEPPAGDPPMLGAGGVHVFVFTTTQHGLGRIQFQYKRSWAGGEAEPPHEVRVYAVAGGVIPGGKGKASFGKPGGKGKPFFGKPDFDKPPTDTEKPSTDKGDKGISDTKTPAKLPPE